MLKLCFWIVLSVFSFQASAIQIEPASLSYQGVLTDVSGKPLPDGVKAISISLFNSPTGGTPFWSDAYNAVLRNGQFSVVLGSDIKPLTGLFSEFNGTTYIEIKVGTDQPMSRQKLTSVAYAINAKRSAVADTVTSTDSIIPTGTVIAFAGFTLPAGWLWCDGASYKKSLYPKLYAAIERIYGGDNDNFNVPDYGGRFLRGVDNSITEKRDIETDSRTRMTPSAIKKDNYNVGSVQNDAFKTHSHGLNSVIWGDATRYVVASRYGEGYPNGDLYTTTNVTNPPGASETRSKNASVYWIIKY